MDRKKRFPTMLGYKGLVQRLMQDLRVLQRPLVCFELLSQTLQQPILNH